MAIAFTFSTSKGTAINGGTSNSVDSTGANLIVIGIHRYGTNTLTVSDSKSNTWTPLTSYQTAAQSGIRFYYCLVPTVGSGHTFTIGVTAGYPAITVMGFSGVKTSTPFDVENGATNATGTSRQPGSVTPADNGSLVVAGMTLNGATSAQSVNSSMTLQEYAAYSSGNSMGALAAYYVQPTAAAINPTFSWTTSVGNSAAIAVFKPEPAAGLGIPIAAYHYNHHLFSMAG